MQMLTIRFGGLASAAVARLSSHGKASSAELVRRKWRRVVDMVVSALIGDSPKVESKAK